MNALKGFVMAVSMFTALPVPRLWEERATRHVLRCFPLVGLLVGGIHFGVWMLLRHFEVGGAFGAVVLLLVPTVLTGGIHLDGFADCADAVLSRADDEKKRQILKDPHIGAFGVVSLITCFLTSFALYFDLLASGKTLLILLFLPAVARCVSAATLFTFPLMAQSGFSHTFKQHNGVPQTIFLLLTSGVLIALCGLHDITAAGALLVAAVVGVAISGYVIKQLGGINGDVCGLCVVVTEMFGLLILRLL